MNASTTEETAAPAVVLTRSEDAASTPSTGARVEDEAEERCLRPYWQQKYRRETCRNWDKFYKRNGTNFFKDRHWLDRDFAPYLGLSATDVAGDVDGQDSLYDTASTACAVAQEKPALASGITTTGLEIGCGVGNLAFPLLALHKALKLYVCDFSPTAIDLVRRHADFAELDERGRISAFVADLTACTGIDTASGTTTAIDVTNAHPDTDAATSSMASVDCSSTTPASSITATATASTAAASDALDCIRPRSLDFITSIFCLGAIDPVHQARIVSALCGKLRSGGCFLFRDYAAGDMAEARFANPSQASGGGSGGGGVVEEAPRIGRRLYVRQDGTMSYFFTTDDVIAFAEGAKLHVVSIELVRRQLENRKTGLSGTRIFLQAVLRKP